MVLHQAGSIYRLDLFDRDHAVGTGWTPTHTHTPSIPANQDIPTTQSIQWCATVESSASLSAVVLSGECNESSVWKK